MNASPSSSDYLVEVKGVSNQQFECDLELNPRLSWRNIEKWDCFLSQPQEEKQYSLEIPSLSAIFVVSS